MAKWLNKSSFLTFGIVFLFLIVIGFIVYTSSTTNKQANTINSRASGCENCDNKSQWVSDCLRYNGSDKTQQCNDWFNA